MNASQATRIKSPAQMLRVTELPGASPELLALREELLGGGMKAVADFALGDLKVEICQGRDAIWALVRREGKGGVAVRAIHAAGGIRSLDTIRPAAGEALRLEAESALGTHQAHFTLHEAPLPVLRITTSIVPAVPLLLPFRPRDLYPLDADDDPIGARGRMEAAQRGMNSGVAYFRLEEPDFGSVLYFQNLTAMNPYFEATGTKPDGVIGGIWPEIGYLLPSPAQHGTPVAKPLPAGEAMTVSDALLAFHRDAGGDEQAMAARYLSLLGAIYRRIERPETHYHDWAGRAERALHDLTHAPEASLRQYGFRYIHPYTDAEYPDSMVQLSVLAAIRDYEVWTHRKTSVGAELAAGLRKFYDRKLKTIRRYLPNVGKDKNRNAVDSWYLYHPLLNLGRLALDGDAKARRLFEQAIDFAIQAAHHFDYRWPIQFDVTDFSVITASRNEGGLGQTDVGGLYAYVMLQAFDLTGDKRFLDEARAAIDAAKGMRFELNYQANLTAWGAAACLRLWRITTDETYLRQSYVYLASFFHNTALWESEIGHAKHYTNFLGVTALHDGPYMALYECFDSFTAFEQYLKDSGPDLDPAARLLVSQYCRYALDRAWYYYPDALPKDAIAPQQRENNGHVDRALSFPVEDLYIDGQPAGQVGQEIYGVGSAFVFASRAFHTVRDAPFLLFCDHFLLASERPADRSLTFQLGGADGMDAAFSVIRKGRAPIPDVTVETDTGEPIHPRHRQPDRIDFSIPADGRIAVRW